MSSGFIPEITTTVKVTTNSEGLDNSIKLLEENEITNLVFNDVKDYLNNVKDELDRVSDEYAFAVSEELSSTQQQIISMHHNFTGMMMNSVDISKDGNAQYLVGNTARSVDGFPYPLAIETGRREVVPVEAKVLRWWTSPYFSGEVVFAKRSKAVSADPFVQPSINTAMEILEPLLEDHFGTLFK